MEISTRSKRKSPFGVNWKNISFIFAGCLRDAGRITGKYIGTVS